MNHEALRHAFFSSYFLLFLLCLTTLSLDALCIGARVMQGIWKEEPERPPLVGEVSANFCE
jgi:hypothetical protein